MSIPAGWSPDWPLKGDANPTVYDVFIQPWYAIRERTWALGGQFFPNVSRPWESGTVTAAVDNGDGTSTLTVAGKTWHLPSEGLKNPWDQTGSSTTTLPTFAPLVWRASIDSLDPVECASGDVSTWTGNTLTIGVRLDDWPTSGRVAGASDFVGRTVYLYAAGNPWWDERWPAWPNVPRLAWGTIASATTKTANVRHVSWAKDKWKGKELICRDAAGKLLRLTLTGNGVDDTVTPAEAQLTFAATSPVPAGDFAIIDAGGRYLPGQAFYPALFYGGLPQGIYSHLWDDTLGVLPVPLASLDVADASDPDFCDPPQHVTVLDADPLTLPDNACGPASQILNPNVSKTYRFLQATLDSIDGLFQPSTGPLGNTKDAALNGFAQATWLKAWGAPTATLTTGTVGTNDDGDAGITLSGTGTLPYYPLEVSWAILDAGGAVLKQGGATLAGDGFLIGGFTSPDDEGKTIVFAPGWERFLEKQVARFFPVRYWMPDFDPDAPGDSPTIIYPPREPNPGETAGPGHWVTIDPSDHYSYPTATGARAEGTLDVDKVKDRDVVRYVPGSFVDPTTPYSPDDEGAMPPQAPFYDRSYGGKRSLANQTKRDASRRGTVDAANVTTRHLIDPKRDWFNCDYFGGMLIELSGTATGGGSTNLIDATKASSAFWTQTPSWLFEQTVEVQNGVDADGNPSYEPRLITSQSGDNLQWAEQLAGGAAHGKAWRIQVPDSVVNPWKGRKLELTPTLADGTRGDTVTVKLDGNGRRALFFPTIVVPPTAVSWDYEIIDPAPYGVYRRDQSAGEWVLPTGPDTPKRFGRTDVNKFHADTFENFPDVIRRFGRFLPGDSLVEVMNQVYRGINALKVTKKSGGWTAASSDSDTSPAINSVSGNTGEAYGAECTVCKDPHNVYLGDDTATGGSCTGGTLTVPTDMYSFVAQQWSGARSGGTHTVAENTAPQASSFLQICGSDGVYGCGVSASATASHYKINVQAYGSLTHTTGFWDFGQIDAGDTAAATGGTATGDDGEGHTFTYCNPTHVLASQDGRVGYHVWTQFSTGGGGTGDEFSSLLGSTTQPEPLTFVTCPSPDNGPCDQFAESFGGYYVANAAAFLTWGFGFHG